MDLSALLNPAAVKVVGAPLTRKRLLQELAEIARDVYGLNVPQTVDALQERESLGPTGVGQGVALPHGRIEGLDQVFGVFLRLEKPLDFDSADRQPVDLVFALFTARDAGVAHLKALAAVSRTLRDPDIRAKLRANSDPAALHAILTEMRASQAA